MAGIATLERAAVAPPQARTSMPWYGFSALFAATAVLVGLHWDISWHRTIGRDSFWTPAHVAIYLGGIVAGLSCGWVALRTTFAGSAEARAASVRFWGFRAPLGAWVCIWGTFAMLTSAPFDDWWHNAYGLDVEILSPPHAVLALGIAAIAIGALLLVTALQNRSGRSDARRFALLHAYTAGVLLTLVAILITEYTLRIRMHSSIFYQVTCGVFPFFLVSSIRASRLRWPATATAAMYTALTLVMVWILPLFAAEPKLGPIRQPITHMVPPDFPLLIVLPAVILDLVSRRYGTPRRDWLFAAVLGASFFTVFLAAQWWFAEFLLSPGSHNWFFAGDNWVYALPKESFTFRMWFRPEDPGGELVLMRGLLVALLLAMLSARAGLWRGDWLARVQR